MGWIVFRFPNEYSFCLVIALTTHLFACRVCLFLNSIHTYILRQLPDLVEIFYVQNGAAKHSGPVVFKPCTAFQSCNTEIVDSNSTRGVDECLHFSLFPYPVQVGVLRRVDPSFKDYTNTFTDPENGRPQSSELQRLRATLSSISTSRVHGMRTSRKVAVQRSSFLT